MNKKLNRADGVATYKKILETAGELFAEKGFTNTTNKEIAHIAQINLASINYHFGTCEGLYKAVLVEAHNRILSVTELKSLINEAQTAEQKLESIIKNMTYKIMTHQSWASRVLCRVIVNNPDNILLLDEIVFSQSSIVQKILSDLTGYSPNDPILIRYLFSMYSPLLVIFLLGKILPPPLDSIQNSSPDNLANHFYEFAIAGLKKLS